MNSAVHTMQDKLEAGNDASKWSVLQRSQYESKILGLVFIRPLFSPSPLQYLTAHQREVRQFWGQIIQGDRPMFYYEIVEVCALDEPQFAHAVGAPNYAANAHVPRTVVFDITASSASRLWLGSSAGQRLADVASTWAAKHNQAFGEPPVLAISMPIPHALLCTLRKFSSNALPMPIGIGKPDVSLKKWLGIARLKAITGGVNFVESDLIESALGPLSADGFQMCADVIRQLADPDTLRTPDFMDLCRHSVQWLQHHADTMSGNSCRHGNQAHDIQVLINAVMFSGFLKHSGEAVNALLFALRACCPNRQFLEFFTKQLLEKKVLPSRSSIYQHRLTLHLGWVLVQREEFDALFASEGGAATYLTMDSSPQGNFDWLQHSCQTIRDDDLLKVLDMSLRIQESDEIDIDHASDLEFLAGVLIWRVGVPTGIGSGRASALHKMHAFLHARRLFASSWKLVASFVRSIITCTGDLGTESLLPDMKAFPVRRLFPWVQEADSMAEFAFDFQPEGSIEDAPEERPRAEDFAGEETIDFSDCLYIPGLLHIIHNAVGSLLTTLLHAENWISQLRPVSRFLGHFWSRQRLRATCFVGEPAASFSHLYRHFSSILYTDRWGCVIQTVMDLLPLEESLRQFWSKQAYMFASAGDSNGRHIQDQSELNSFDTAITSPFFWASWFEIHDMFYFLFAF